MTRKVLEKLVCQKLEQLQRWFARKLSPARDAPRVMYLRDLFEVGINLMGVVP